MTTLVPETKSYDVGVIVGRFQTPDLTEGHRQLIETVLAKHKRVIIFVGNTTLRNTRQYPIDYKHRKLMIQAAYPTVDIERLDNKRCDKEWSRTLDHSIYNMLSPGQRAVLYGSRDSFAKAYTGKLPVIILKDVSGTSATEMRKAVSINYPSSPQYRAGLIAASMQRYPSAQQTVDAAIVDLSDKRKLRLLLIRKPSEKTDFQFCGGYSDVRSMSLEEDAKREVQEETQVEVGEPQYIGSTIIDDWRYRGEQDKIKTAFFLTPYVFGQAKGSDDAEEARWWNLDINNLQTLNNIPLIPEHAPLMEMFKTYIQNHKYKFIP